ncbi:MAG: ORF6N domain-containing protein [Candidatus Omnitrophica bacterium]|nr:ORF6N domain-containing protein [Candidatus Omnitrophota bacterium]
MKELMPAEAITAKIFLIRGRKVMLDRDLAQLYEVETYRLNEQVKRNKKRFPDDFMFQLTNQEAKNLISQNAISSWGGVRKLPHVFTQEGVAMLSSVLNSDRAVQVNIRIMRAFMKLRYALSFNKQFEIKLRELEGRLNMHDKDIGDIFEAIRQLIRIPGEKRKIKGFAQK